YCNLVYNMNPTNLEINKSSIFYDICNFLTPKNTELLIIGQTIFQAADILINFTRGHGDNKKKFQYKDYRIKLINIVGWKLFLPY
ncbi:hypothetical protein BO83DRAFT_326710, partial [Aspergillus eucalypticola CBS 122712]